MKAARAVAALVLAAYFVAVVAMFLLAVGITFVAGDI